MPLAFTSARILPELSVWSVHLIRRSIASMIGCMSQGEYMKEISTGFLARGLMCNGRVCVYLISHDTLCIKSLLHMEQTFNKYIFFPKKSQHSNEETGQSENSGSHNRYEHVHPMEKLIQNYQIFVKRKKPNIF